LIGTKIVEGGRSYSMPARIVKQSSPPRDQNFSRAVAQGFTSPSSSLRGA
jgi:hypothetical protein